MVNWNTLIVHSAEAVTHSFTSCAVVMVQISSNSTGTIDVSEGQTVYVCASVSGASIERDVRVMLATTGVDTDDPTGKVVLLIYECC